jgi:hypothetical protein
MYKKTILAILLVVAVLALIWWRSREFNRPRKVALRGSGNVITIAATGDWCVDASVRSHAKDRQLAGVTDILKGSSAALANLEESLLDSGQIPPPEVNGTIRPPYGTARQARELVDFGITLVSLANNHAMNYGADGLSQTQRILDSYGIGHSGAGTDLAMAAAAVEFGSRPRRVAVMAVATSAPAEARATRTQGEIRGRPGINVLRYLPEITADPQSFAVLKRSAIANPSNQPDQDRQLLVAGNLIKEGPATSVEFVSSEEDRDAILAQVKLARSKSDIVVVMLHSHEPKNDSSVPADFVRAFAHHLIDAGANLIVGTGPHQLRGIEIYGRGAILYSLGDFMLDYGPAGRRAEDVYDSGGDLYRLALGTNGGGMTPEESSEAKGQGRESAIAVTKFCHGSIESIRIQPIELGIGRGDSKPGIPRIPLTPLSTDILGRLTALSQQWGTTIRVEGGVGFVELESGACK